MHNRRPAEAVHFPTAAEELECNNVARAEHLRNSMDKLDLWHLPSATCDTLSADTASAARAKRYERPGPSGGPHEGVIIAVGRCLWLDAGLGKGGVCTLVSQHN